ncbi:hypothetical protein NST21_13580 [Peribacillus sp. FSL K6-1552]
MGGCDTEQKQGKALARQRDEFREDRPRKHSKKTLQAASTSRFRIV